MLKTKRVAIYFYSQQNKILPINIDTNQLLYTIWCIFNNYSKKICLFLMKCLPLHRQKWYLSAEENLLCSNIENVERALWQKKDVFSTSGGDLSTLYVITGCHIIVMLSSVP